MGMVSLRDPARFDIRDDVGEAHGCNQEWYRTLWQRMAGCGPCAASNLVQYERGAPASRDEWIALMHDIWSYVTPGVRGLDRIDRFVSGMESYARSVGLVAACSALEVPPPAAPRPTVERAMAFCEEMLCADLPVAFLNLDSGQETSLETWHWVTIVSLNRQGEEAIATYLDGGDIKRADIALWLRTTRQGGGFVGATWHAHDEGGKP